MTLFSHCFHFTPCLVFLIQHSTNPRQLPIVLVHRIMSPVKRNILIARTLLCESAVLVHASRYLGMVLV